MQVIILILASLLTVGWLILLFRTTQKDWIAISSVSALDIQARIARFREKSKNAGAIHPLLKSFPLFVLKLVASGDIKKKIKKLEHNEASMQKGKVNVLSVLIAPGYVLQRKFEIIGKGSVHKTIAAKCFELYGKKYATEKARQLLARVLSYSALGTACTLALGTIFIGIADIAIGLTVMGICVLLVLFLSYAIYDELNDSLTKRRSAISKQFPNAVSKLALLVTSGMIMDKAWKQTAFSKEAELYLEMRMTSEELENLVSPEVAYSNFITHCNTKETAKLASAIMQNLSKGNKEIGRLLKDMAREAWLERRHTAKREAEKANSKLMIPTMMLFLAILMMLMVPIAMNFTGI